MKFTNALIYLILTPLFFILIQSSHAQVPDLIITEIMYNPPESGTDSLEYLEIYNNENTSISLEGFQFSQGINYTFPNIEMLPNQYLVIAKDTVALQNQLGVTALQWLTGTLSNSGETIELINQLGETIDLVSYDNVEPWPMEANGLGASLVLCSLDNNDLPENWQAATTPTTIIINNKEIIANPNTSSACPTGPIISFLENEISLSEDSLTIYLQITIKNGNSIPTTTELHVDNLSTATWNEDYTMDNLPPTVISFPEGVETDTQIIELEILEDLVIESNEFLIFELLNPDNDAIIDPMRDRLEVIIEDDDATLPDLVISEIMYNPPEVGLDSTEFIELYNNDTIQVNLVDYYFSQGVNFTFPEYIINPGEYIVISNDSNAFFNYYGFLPWQWTSGSLTNSGETIELRNAGGNVADLVQYDNISIWSLEADGNGSSLVVCDPNEDNNDPTNWSSSISSTGILIEGIEITADPAMANNCFIPLSAYPNRSIGEMISIDADGVADSLNKKCELVGIVHGINFNESNGGLQFALLDDIDDAITLYSNSNNFGYEVVEGDEIVVQGTISQFNGLLEIIPDTLWLISDNNPLTTPTEVNILDESTESQLITIKNLTILNPNNWDNSEPTGFTVQVSNGMDTFDMRIDQDVDLYQMPVPNFSFNLTGIGNQFDLNIPYLEGYQIMPRYSADLEMITSISKSLDSNPIKVYPNPTKDIFKIEMEFEVDKIRIENMLGQLIEEIDFIDHPIEINCQDWETGVYWVSVFSNNKIRPFKIMKIE